MRVFLIVVVAVGVVVGMTLHRAANAGAGPAPPAEPAARLPDHAPPAVQKLVHLERTPRAEAMKVEIESLDGTIQAGLEELGKATAEFAAERSKWSALDRSVASARAVNRALLARNRAVVDLYEGKLVGPISQFKAKLKEAPAVYRQLADERRQLAAQSTLEVERRNYQAMVEVCLSAATLCERRYRELFWEVAEESSSGRRPRANAVTLARTITNMKRFQQVHVTWEETLSPFPTALESPKLGEWFTALAVYGEDMDAFTQSVEGLKEVMRQKGEAPAPSRAPAPAAPAATDQKRDEPPPVPAMTTQAVAPRPEPEATQATPAVARPTPTPEPVSYAYAVVPPTPVTYVAAPAGRGRVRYVPAN